jgi:regulator of sirC expression with transglutaminase-like and TPR domain
VIRQQLVRAFTHAALSPDPDLAVAALMIARVEHPRLDAGPYLDQLDAFGREAKLRVAGALVVPGDAPASVDPDRYARVLALNDYLFGELRFVGNDVHYEDPRNSFLNEVLDRRTGIPITLALLYMEVARRAGLHVEGINFPGHFLLRCPARRGLQYAEDLIIDAYHGGALLSEAACRDLLRKHTTVDGDAASGSPDAEDGMQQAADFERHLLGHATKPQILARMLLNLKRTYVRMHSFPQARDITELLLAVDPSAINELRDRGLLAYHLKDFPAALRDLQTYLQLAARSGNEGEREEHAQIWEHVKTLRRRVASLN